MSPFILDVLHFAAAGSQPAESKKTPSLMLVNRYPHKLDQKKSFAKNSQNVSAIRSVKVTL
ncbi:hypothetical protein CEF21_17110 [Bacillus sp. FJAT-42376]|nr:hypothetical protein CEF21_17110 [Bacillus sp. FJAT-42376]